MSPLLARVAYAVLVGIITFVVITVIGQLLNINLIVAYAGIIGVLAAIVTFFSRATPPSL